MVKIGLLAKFSKLLLAGLLAGKKVSAGLFVAAIAAARKFFGRRPDSVEATGSLSVRRAQRVSQRVP